jgi:hypothetical protein
MKSSPIYNKLQYYLIEQVYAYFLPCCCGANCEDSYHFFFDCSYYANIRHTLCCNLSWLTTYSQRHSVRGNLTGQHLLCGTISQAASDMNNQWEFSRNHWKHIFLDLPMLILSSWWCAVTMYFYFLMIHVCFNSWWNLIT